MRNYVRNAPSTRMLGRLLNPSRTLLLVGASILSALLSAVAYFVWGITESLISISVLTPTVAPDMTITPSTPAPLTSALATVCAAAATASIVSGLLLAHRLRAVWPAVAIALLAGPAAIVVGGFVLSTQAYPDAYLSNPVWLWVPETAGEWSAFTLVVMIPPIAFNLAAAARLRRHRVSGPRGGF